MRTGFSKRTWLIAVGSGVVCHATIILAICTLAGYTFLAEGKLLYLALFDRGFATPAAVLLLLAGAVVAFATLRVGRALGVFVMTAAVWHLFYILGLRDLPLPQAICADTITAAAQFRIRTLEDRDKGGPLHGADFWKQFGHHVFSPDGSTLYFSGHGLIFSIILDTAARPPVVSVQFRR